MNIKTRKQQRVYKQQAYGLLGELESALKALEEIPDNEDYIGRVFRAIHTIKGSSAMFGFDTIAAFTHELETVFDLVRKGKITVTRKLINFALSARDLISEVLDDSETDSAVEPEKAKSIINGLKTLIPSISQNETGLSDASKSSTDDELSRLEEATMRTYQIRFRPSRDIFTNGTNPAPLLDELSQMGKCHIMANTDAIPMLSDITPECCYVFWDIILTTDKNAKTIEDVFIFVADVCQISILVIDEDNGGITK